MKRSFELIIGLFFIFGFLFVPLTFNGKNWQFQFTNFLFSKPISFFQSIFFPIALQQIDFSSDTIALNCLLILLLVLASFCVIILSFFKLKSDKITKCSRLISSYYIAFVLLKYGFDKIFKAQFYLPEPNILYSQFGNLSKDILYWSTIGTSYSYSVSMGIIEVATAFLLLFKRTRIVGLLIAAGIFITVIIINFGFDISVKTFSLFLLFATLFALFPYLKTLFNFLILHKQEQIKLEKVALLTNSVLKFWIKTMLIGMMLLQILVPYVESNNFNDDNFQRNFLHGAYQVTKITTKNGTLKASDFPIKKLFIHRNNYLIFQNDTKMTDYHFEINAFQTQLILENYKKEKIIVNFTFVKKDSILTVDFNKFHIVAKAIDWRKLPVLKKNLHFTVDEVQ